MSITLNKNFSTPELDRLFELYLQSEITPSTSYIQLRGIAKEAESQLTGLEKERVLAGGFHIGLNLFDMDDADQSISRFELFAGFNNFVKTLFGILLKHKADENSTKTVSRKRLPDLQAFNSIGTNDLRIDYASADYTLVYGA